MAVTVSYGTCAKCKKSNDKSLQACRNCGVALPWAKPAKTPIAAKPTARTTPVSNAGQRANAVDPTYWAMGLFLFCLSFAAPMLGYGIFRFLNNSDNELAGFANTGMFLGVIVWGLGFVAMMAKVGPPPPH